MQERHEVTMLRTAAAMIRRHLRQLGDVLGPAVVENWEAVAASKEQLADALELAPQVRLPMAPL